MERKSYFNGTLLSMIGHQLLAGLIIIFTLGIGTPWAVVLLEKWRADHSVVSDRQLSFEGSGGALIGQYIKWALLTIVTLGIYGLWAELNLIKWTTEHTHFADNRGTGDSYFEGSVIELFIYSLGLALIVIFTLGLGTPWAIAMFQKWRLSNTVIDGERLEFVGTGGNLFGQYVKWLLLCIVTLGIYSFWLDLNVLKWNVKNTEIRA